MEFFLQEGDLLENGVAYKKRVFSKQIQECDILILRMILQASDRCLNYKMGGCKDFQFIIWTLIILPQYPRGPNNPGGWKFRFNASKEKKCITGVQLFFGKFTRGAGTSIKHPRVHDFFL